MGVWRGLEEFLWREKGGKTLVKMGRKGGKNWEFTFRASLETEGFGFREVMKLRASVKLEGFRVQSQL